MSFNIDFDTSELVTFANELLAVVQKVPSQTQSVVNKTAKDIEATAKAIVPVDTGNLRSSINTQPSRGASRSSVTIGADVVAGTKYAKYLEFGTSRMTARPFMGPASAKHEPAFLAAMQQLVSKI
ncbi:HK97-gp10 family putative phage morphogenesis protein [Glutamicibacter sp. NPDC087344]|uniref:HK97-gp10 family putative phage morphogenesis protein n=1 Tax=Glutamicibacter sp. NPDC087344 TaxID=3363994 RepID=UPI003804B2F5